MLSSKSLDINKYLGADIVDMRAKEAALRMPLSIPKSPGRKDSNQGGAILNPHEGLISVFEDDGVLVQMNEHANDPMSFSKLLSRFSRQITTVTDLAAFRANFESDVIGFKESRYGVLQCLTPILKDEPVLIAGGAVLRALTLHPDIQTRLDWQEQRHIGKAGDIDIFVYTQDPTQASQVAQQIFLAPTAGKSDEEFRVTRTTGVINVELFQPEYDNEDIDKRLYGDEDIDGELVTVQIVLRLYESPAEVLLGFDCDCCCLGYDGERVWALPRAVRAIQYGTNILNPLHAWPTKASYEFRLVKYALKGYPISVPGMETVDVDLTKIIGSPLSGLRGFARLIRLAQAFDDTHVDGSDVKTPSFYTYGGIKHPLKKEDRGKCDKAHSHDETGRQELAATLRTALGEYEYKRLTAAAWKYNDDGRFTVTIPKSELKALGVAHGAGQHAWAAIEECTAEHATDHKIPVKLMDAWDCAKRSREYLNAKETDLDARYFAHAARDTSSKMSAR